jgi:hypothetical protein
LFSAASVPALTARDRLDPDDPARFPHATASQVEYGAGVRRFGAAGQNAKE